MSNNEIFPPRCFLYISTCWCYWSEVFWMDMNLTIIKRMSVPWETPANLSSTGVHLLLNYTFSSVIFQKMDSVPTRLRGWWEWVRQRDSTVSLAPFLSQISTFNLLWKKETKNWTHHPITIMPFRCLPLQPSMFAGVMLWMMGTKEWGLSGNLMLFCLIRDNSNVSRAHGYSLNLALKDVKNWCVIWQPKVPILNAGGNFWQCLQRQLREVRDKIGTT